MFHIIIYRIMNDENKKYNVREIIANVLEAVGMNGPGCRNIDALICWAGVWIQCFWRCGFGV